MSEIIKKIQLKMGLNKVFPKIVPDGRGLPIEEGGTNAVTAAEALKNLKAYDLDRGTEILENADLDDYKDLGVYYCQSATIARTLSNTPYTGSNFKLIVERVGADSYRKQTLIGGWKECEVYTRLYYSDSGGGWADWVKIDTSYREPIPSHTDLNTYKTPGRYKCDANDTAATLANRPCAHAFIMDVYSPNGGNTSYMCQEVMTYKGDVYRRFTENALSATPTWGPWYLCGAGINYERTSNNTAQLSDYTDDIYPIVGCEILPNGSNLNSLTHSGFFYTSNNTISNKPSDAGYAMVINIMYGSAFAQICIDITNEQMYFRVYGNSWRPWHKITFS